MNVRALIFFLSFLCIGFGEVYPNESKNITFFQVIREAFQKIFEILKKLLSDKLEISNTTLKPMQNSSTTKDPYTYSKKQ